jgi:hypothetical protein
MYVLPVTAAHAVQTLPAPQTALPESMRPWQYVFPAVPGQHASAPVPPMHGCVAQHMSAAFVVQTPGLPPPVAPPGGVPVQSVVLGVHAPVVVLQTSPVGHCESSVHLPHWFVPPPPQTGPLAFVVQSALVQQLPGTQAQVPPFVQSAAPPARQQKSALFAEHAPAAAHVEATHPPVVVSQIVPGP